MATKNVDFREGIEIVFADGEKRVVRPLTIRRMRKFMGIVKNLGSVEDSSNVDDHQIDIMLQASAIALEADYPDVAANIDGLEDLIDMRIFNQLMSAAMGTDPNE